MVEKFADAALRHLETAEVLEDEGRIDDAAYHYGLVGETALKAAVIKATNPSAPLHQDLFKHINQTGRNGKCNSLQKAIANHVQKTSLLAGGRLGGALTSEIKNNNLSNRFNGWSLNIRYADSDCCPVKPNDLAVWKADAKALYNGGVF